MSKGVRQDVDQGVCNGGCECGLSSVCGVVLHGVYKALCEGVSSNGARTCARQHERACASA
eukprot:6199858-Pleurochrysis_carterae.AAC.2